MVYALYSSFHALVQSQPTGWECPMMAEHLTQSFAPLCFPLGGKVQGWNNLRPSRGESVAVFNAFVNILKPHKGPGISLCEMS